MKLRKRISAICFLRCCWSGDQQCTKEFQQFLFSLDETKTNMKKIYFLSTCDTCKLILNDIDAKKKGFELQDIKTEKITAQQLEEMKKMAGSYEALFSKRAIKYKELGLKDKSLTEKDYRDFILEEYTFLKRPVTILNNKIFVGNEKKTIEELKNAVK